MRLELSKKTDLAIRAIEELCAADGRVVGGQRLAEALQTSTHRVPQVMQALVTQQWVASISGPNGGYRLVADPDQISLLNVIEAVEGKFPDDRCVLRGAPCPIPEPCALHVPWSRAREALMSELANAPVTEGQCRARIGGG